MREVRLVALLIALVMVAAATPVTAADLAGAKKNFERFCATCHGPQGRGNGSLGAALSITPVDLMDCAHMKDITDETLFTAIENGGKLGNMPAWKDGLEDGEIHDLVAYVRSLCKQ